MSPRTFFISAIVAAVAIASANAESHLVTFVNNCGFGTPMLIQGANTLSTGGNYISNGPLNSAIAYLQTGNCLFNGENCLTVETTLTNPTSVPGSGSSTDLSLIPPHAFSVTTGFGYFDGCDGAGTDCTDGNCNTAFHVTSDTGVQVACQADDVSLAITFCK